MSQILFIRHAQASFGDDNYDRLSDLGVRQAGILGDYLARRELRFDAVYSGSMERQIHTARAVISRLSEAGVRSELRTTSEFDEYDSAAITRSHLADPMPDDPSVPRTPKDLFADPKTFQGIFERAVLRWVSGDRPIEGVETWSSFNRRVQAGVRRVMEENGREKTVAVFTSGGPISAVMKMALNLSDENTIALSWQIQNTAVSTFLYNDRNFTLLSFNSVAHLELENEGRLLTYR